MKIYYKSEIEMVQSEGLLLVDKDKIYYSDVMFTSVTSYSKNKKGTKLKDRKLEDYIIKEYQAVYVGEL